MTLQSIVKTAFRTGLLTARQDHQMVVLVQQGRYTQAELSQVDALIEAVIEGAITMEPDPRTLELQEELTLRCA